MLSFPSSVVPPPTVLPNPKMVMADGVPPPLVETCVLLPEDFALKVEAPNARVSSSLLNLLPHLAPSAPGHSHLSQPLLERLNPSLGPLSSPLSPLSPALSPLGLSFGGSPHNDDSIKVCATRRLPAHTRYLPFSGTVRADKLPLMPCLPPMDPRLRYGSYDEVCERPTGRVRLCNWVRFVGYSLHFTPQVNMVASKVRESVVFEIVREVAPGERLLAFFLPDMSADDTLLLPALTLLRSSLYRRTIDSIMAEAPLDLSRSLLTSPPSPPPPEATSDSGERRLKRKPEDHSPVRRSPSPVPLSPRHTNTPPSTSIPHFPPIPSSFFTMRSPAMGLGLTDLDSGRTPPITLNLTPPSSSGLSSSNSTGRTSSTSSDFSASRSNDTPVSLGPPKRRERTMLPCSECGKAFDRPSLLKRHIRTHTGEKPHVCDVCGKGFSTSSSLNTHRRIHSGEKPHQCGVCGKRFTASSNLYYHKMTHVKEKPHKCSLCTRSFPTPGDLRSHMFVHNGQWPHKCSVCGKGFSKLTNLRNHALLHAEMKRNERHLTSIPASLASPPSTSSPDAALTPPAGYTPPTYSPFIPSTSSYSSDIPLSPTTSQPLRSSSASPSGSIVLSSSPGPNSPVPIDDKTGAPTMPSKTRDRSHTEQKPESDDKDKNSSTGPNPLQNTIRVRNDVEINNLGNLNQNDDDSKSNEAPVQNVTIISSAPSSLVPRQTPAPKLSFSLDSLLASTKPKNERPVSPEGGSAVDENKQALEVNPITAEGMRESSEENEIDKEVIPEDRENRQSHSTTGGYPEATNIKKEAR